MQDGNLIQRPWVLCILAVMIGLLALSRPARADSFDSSQIAAEDLSVLASVQAADAIAWTATAGDGSTSVMIIRDWAGVSFTLDPRSMGQSMVVVSPTPEPGTPLLLASALIAVGLWMRRKLRSAEA